MLIKNVMGINMKSGLLYMYTYDNGSDVDNHEQVSTLVPPHVTRTARPWAVGKGFSPTHITGLKFF